MIPVIPQITVRPVAIKQLKCVGCGNIFHPSQLERTSEWESAPSPGFPNGSERLYSVSPCCFDEYTEVEEEDEEEEYEQD